MHNGVFETLEEVMEFYNDGGGEGRGLYVEHQTLPSDSLGLTEQEQSDIIAFMKSLSDTTGMQSIPHRLPAFQGESHLESAGDRRRILNLVEATAFGKMPFLICFLFQGISSFPKKSYAGVKCD